MSDDRQAIQEARMLLAQMVTRSASASVETDSSGRAARAARLGAAHRLRRAGHADLAQKMDLNEDVTASSARADCREIMNLIDARVEAVDDVPDFSAGGDAR
jgi:hypothetical protein